jgi:hypothetical protein
MKLNHLTRKLKQNKNNFKKNEILHQLSMKTQNETDDQKQRNKIEEGKLKSRLQKEKAKLDAQLKEEESFECLKQELKLENGGY